MKTRKDYEGQMNLPPCKVTCTKCGQEVRGYLNRHKCKPQHTPTPWKIHDSERVAGPSPNGLNVPIVCKVPIDDQGKADAAFIVRAVNMHQLLIDDARSSMEWFEANGYYIEAANIRRLLAKAAGE